MHHDPGPVRSALPGMEWPGIPAEPGATLLGLLCQFDQTQWLSPEVTRERQYEQAARLLEHARRTVAFYERRLAALDLRAGLDPEAYRRIPLMRRRDIQEAGNALYSR